MPIEYPKLRSEFGPWRPDDEGRMSTCGPVRLRRAASSPASLCTQSYHDLSISKWPRSNWNGPSSPDLPNPAEFRLTDEDLAIGTYRRAVSKVIPEMTKVALASRGKQMAKEIPDFNRKLFLYHSHAPTMRSHGAATIQAGTGRPHPGVSVALCSQKLAPSAGSPIRIQRRRPKTSIWRV